MPSTARRYIYAGFLLLLSSLALSLAALYSRGWVEETTRRITVNNTGSLYLAAALAGAEGAVNISIVFSTDCEPGVKLILSDPAYNISVEELVVPGKELRVNMTPTTAVYVEPLEGGQCFLDARVEAAGRSFPYRWLSLPSLVLMVAGTAALSLGAVLRLAGLEEA